MRRNPRAQLALLLVASALAAPPAPASVRSGLSFDATAHVPTGQAIEPFVPRDIHWIVEGSGSILGFGAQVVQSTPQVTVISGEPRAGWTDLDYSASGVLVVLGECEPIEGIEALATFTVGLFSSTPLGPGWEMCLGPVQEEQFPALVDCARTILPWQPLPVDHLPDGCLAPEVCYPGYEHWTSSLPGDRAAPGDTISLPLRLSADLDPPDCGLIWAYTPPYYLEWTLDWDWRVARFAGFEIAPNLADSWAVTVVPLANARIRIELTAQPWHSGGGLAVPGTLRLLAREVGETPLHFEDFQMGGGHYCGNLPRRAARELFTVDGSLRVVPVSTRSWSFGAWKASTP